MKILIVCQDATRASEILGGILDELKKKEDSILINPDADVYFEEVGPRGLEHVNLLIEPDVDDIGKNHLQEVIARSLNLSFRQITVLLPFY